MKVDSALVVNRTGGEVRVALLKGGEPVSFAVERGEDGGVVGNVYKGRVLRVVPGMQSAFVDVGLDRAAFLFGGDVLVPKTEDPQVLPAAPHPQVGEGDDTVVEARIILGDGEGGSSDEQWDSEGGASGEFSPAPLTTSDEPVGSEDPRDPESTLRPGARRPSFATRTERPRIEKLLKPGQEILVQASKDAIGTKGARLTTQIALPGRFLVYLPQSDHAGVSRRILDEVERERLREVAEELRLPGEGFIVRTVCEGVGADTLRADAAALRELWVEISDTGARERPPVLLHSEADLVLRTVRDLFTEDVSKLILDDSKDYRRVLDFVQRFLPEMADRVELYEESVPLFEVTGIERRVGRALGTKVRLPSGGYLVIESTEALTAVDVNSGRYTGGKDLEDTILTVNLEAAAVVMEQLRLRDIGGIIVVDFIDMVDEANRAQVDEAVQAAMALDPARASALPISEFGLVQMTRRRVRENLARNLLSDCEHCGGAGRIKSCETVGYEILREIRRNAYGGDGSVRELVVRCAGPVAQWLLETEGVTLDRYSGELGSPVRVVAESDFPQERFAVSFQVRGRERA
jgi:ribonuclease G